MIFQLVISAGFILAEVVGDNTNNGEKIKLTSGKTIRFYHDGFTTRDDFQEFIKELKSKYGSKNN